MTSVSTEHAALRQRVQSSLDRQGMMQQLGVRLLAVAPGTVTLALPYSDRVTQQQGGFHGGAMGALADIAGGYAALTVAPEGMEVTTVEYKINFLNAFQGGELQATGRVVRGLLNSMFQKIRKVLPKPPCCTGASLLKLPRSCSAGLGAAGEDLRRVEIVAITE